MTPKNFLAFRFLPGLCLEGVDINCRENRGTGLHLHIPSIFYKIFFYTPSTTPIASINYIIPSTYTYPAYDRRSTASSIMNSLTAMAPIRAASLPKPYLCLAVRGYSSTAVTTGLRCVPLMASKKRHQITSKRYAASTPTGQNKEYFPPPKADQIKEVVSSWSHPV